MTCVVNKNVYFKIARREDFESFTTKIIFEVDGYTNYPDLIIA
jgi:hypothetical protein